MNSTRRATAVVAVAAIALVGAIAAPAFAASNQQIAKASTLKASDLSGAGWTATPHEEGEDSTIPACAPTTKAGNVAEKYSANSPDFSNSNGTEITNTVYVFPTVKQAKAYLAAYQLPTALECLQQGLDQALEGSGATATVTDLDVGGAPKGTFDEGVGFQGKITGVPTSENGGSDIYREAVAFRTGRAVFGVTATNPATAYPTTFVYPDTATLVLAGIARLKKNLK